MGLSPWTGQKPDQPHQETEHKENPWHTLFLPLPSGLGLTQLNGDMHEVAQKPSRAPSTAQATEAAGAGPCMERRIPAPGRAMRLRAGLGAVWGQPLLLLGLQSSMSVSQLRPEKPVRQAQR